MGFSMKMALKDELAIFMGFRGWGVTPEKSMVLFQNQGNVYMTTIDTIDQGVSGRTQVANTDLNPTEHFWNKLEHWLHTRPFHPTSVPDLIDALSQL